MGAPTSPSKHHDLKIFAKVPTMFEIGDCSDHVVFSHRFRVTFPYTNVITTKMFKPRDIIVRITRIFPKIFYMFFCPIIIFRQKYGNFYLYSKLVSLGRIQNIISNVYCRVFRLYKM